MAWPFRYAGGPEDLPKRVRLTVEWIGAADEAAYADVMARELERGDSSAGTVVTGVELLTHQGATPPVPLTWRRRLLAWWRT
jgi:hypothetical protein